MHRSPEIQGARNLRDVGGYPTSGGRLTRWRTLYRSGSLHELSQSGTAELFSARSVRQVIDLRWPHEIDQRPDAVPPPTRYRWVPLLPQRTPPESGRGADYRTIVEERAEHLAAIARILLERDGLPAVIHCAEGIDRTGVAVAVLLDAVGVVRSAIEADYLRSARACQGEACTHRVKPNERASREGRPSRADIRAVLQVVEERHGGATRLLVAAGLTERDTKELRERLTTCGTASGARRSRGWRP